MSEQETLKLSPGGDFCRIVKGTNGQQVLVRADSGEDGQIALIASAVFRTPDGQPILAHQIIDGIDIGHALGFEGTPEQMLEYADALLEDLEALLVHQITHEGLEAEHVHDEHCGHSH